MKIFSANRRVRKSRKRFANKEYWKGWRKNSNGVASKYIKV